MERELKFKLDREAYERLALALGDELSRQVQVNHYLDTVGGDITRSGKSMLRIREEGDQHILTFKLGASREDGYFQAEELEVVVVPEVAGALQRGELPAEDLEPLRRLREVFGDVDRLVPQGSMRNLRRVFALDVAGGVQAELDATTYPDETVDYELEVETEHPEEVRAHLHSLGVPLEPQELTKFGRFLLHR